MTFAAIWDLSSVPYRIKSVNWSLLAIGVGQSIQRMGANNAGGRVCDLQFAVCEARIMGVTGDWLTHQMWVLSNRFEVVDDSRNRRAGALFVDFNSRRGEYADSCRARRDLGLLGGAKSGFALNDIPMTCI